MEEEELTELVIPENITKIKDCTFYGCGSLKKVNIHENVTSIGKNAFYSCSNLAIVSLGKNVKDIGKNAFNACTSITECYCYATTPPSYFGTMIGNQSTLYVPIKCSVLYSESHFGGCFDDIVEMY